MRNIIGLNLNGWHDHAVRDWRPDDLEIAPNAEPIETYPGAEGTYCLDGGVASVVVEFADGNFVAGPQATFSPIGRGAGWGTIGRLSRRNRISDLISTFLSGEVHEGFSSQLRASMDAMTVSAQDVVMVISDRAEFDDELRDELLRYLEGPRRLFVRLLWRPVAVALSMIECGRLPSIREGLKILCLDHSGDGIEKQQLVLRELLDHPGIFAPERAGYGEIVGASVGLSALLEECERETAMFNRHLNDAGHEPSRLPVRLIIEGVAPGTREILRLDNGTWTEALAPASSVPQCLKEAIDLGPNDADVVLLTTPLVEPWRGEFVARIIEAVASSTIVIASPAAAAHGALVAGRRIEKDIPHYLDHLEQVSLIGIRDGDLALIDLMPRDAAVPANREYVSEPIRSLSWPARVRNVDFYIKKSGEFRKWRTPDILPPSENEQIEISLRQMPAQGRAKLSATSSTWPTLRVNPLFLDWANLAIDSRSFEEIVLALQPPPKFPERITAKTHSDVWNDARLFQTISQILRILSVAQPPTIDALSAALKRKYKIRVSAPYAGQVVYESFQAIDFDGEAPSDADPNAVARLDWALREVADRLLLDCRRNVPIQSNKLLIVATWAHGRCPPDLQDEMLKAYSARLAHRPHPLLVPVQSEKVLLHGLGRCLTDPGRIKSLLDLIAPDLSRPHRLAALSTILSRTRAAPLVLADRHLALIANGTASILATLLSQSRFAVNFKYALLVVGGLLRVREKEPYALLTARSEPAAALARPLRDIRDMLSRFPNAFAKSAEKIRIVENLLAMLDGAGGDVGVLVETDTLDDPDDDDGT